MREAIEAVIAVLEESSAYHGRKYTNRYTDNRQYHLGYECGLDSAIDKLKGVLANETDNTSGADGYSQDDSRHGQTD